MMSVVRLSWAPGDQVLFSAGLDGNVYGWPVAKEGRLDVIAANNRSSTILDMVVESPSTSFYTHAANTSGKGGGDGGFEGYSTFVLYCMRKSLFPSGASNSFGSGKLTPFTKATGSNTNTEEEKGRSSFIDRVDSCVIFFCGS